MKSLIFFGSFSLLLAQDPPPPVAPAAPAMNTIQPAAELPRELMDISPLAPPDMESPYASPRDAARHRLQAALAELTASRDIKAGLRNMAEAFAIDRSYAPAVLDLGVLSAVAGKWNEAVAALTESVRLNPAYRPDVESQIERLKLIGSLEATAEGKRERRYDETLYQLTGKLDKMSQPDAIAALVQLGRVNPKRWESPALLAALYADHEGYDAAARFLEISLANTTDVRVKSALEASMAVVQRELRFAAAQASANVAADNEEFAKAAESYEKAWKEIAARPSNGINAASAWLLANDTAKACDVLTVLRSAPDNDLATKAKQMLDFLEPIEPAAKRSSGEGAELYKNPGSPDPARIRSMLPAIDTTRALILLRPLPRLVEDPGPVALLESFSANATPGVVLPLPPLSPSRFSAENYWSELAEAARNKPAAIPVDPAPVLSMVDAMSGTGAARSLRITTEPAGARVFLDEQDTALCQTPCELRAANGAHTVRLTLPRYDEIIRPVRLTTPRTDVTESFNPMRGFLALTYSTPTSVKVNGTPVVASLPVELALLPGLYRISTATGTQLEDRWLTIRPGAHLKLPLTADATAPVPSR